MRRVLWRIPYLGAFCYVLALGGLVSAAYWYIGYRDLPGLYSAYKDGEKEAADLKQVLENDTAKAAELEAHVAGLDGDPVELEAAARRNKNVVREGEKIYRFDLAPERRERRAAPDEDVPKTDARNPAE